MYYKNLVETIDACSGINQSIFWHTKDSVQSSYAIIQKDSLQLAKKVFKHISFSRIGLIAEMNQTFIIRFFACQYLGITPVLLPSPSLNQQQWEEKIKGLLLNSGCNTIWNHSALTENLDEIEVFNDNCYFDNEFTDFNIRVNDDAYVQFSSGTTGVQKGIVITQTALMTNIYDILAHGLNIQKHDKAMSWLPFFHDMGLVGFFLAPFVAQCEIHYLHTRHFLKEPLRWLKLISQYKLTISYAPNFAYERLSAIQSNKIPGDLDLSSWRVAGIGAEKIQPQTLIKFTNTFKKHGFCFDAFWPSYGMAEATLAVSMKSVNDDLILSEEDMSCGRILPSFDVIISEPNHDSVGEIMIKSKSLARNYSNGDLIELRDGYFATGDLGYVQNNQLFVIGRKKECVIINGRNLWPQEIEEFLVNKIMPNYYLLVIPMKIDDYDAIGLVFAKSKWCNDEICEVEQENLMLLFSTFGISAQCFFITNRSILKTSSGKPARLLVAQSIKNGELHYINKGNI